MQSSKVRSRLKAQLSKFTSELSEGLSKPLRAFVGEMLFGIQASQDVKLSQIARCLSEEIPLIKTEDRLSRNLKAKELEGHLSERLAALDPLPTAAPRNTYHQIPPLPSGEDQPEASQVRTEIHVSMPK